MPEGWWHAVESPEEVTVALNYWWTDALHQMLGEPRTSAQRTTVSPANVPFVLRRAFEAAVIHEREQLLLQLAAQADCADGSADAAGEDSSREPSDRDHAGCLCECGEPAASVDETERLLRAAECGPLALLRALRSLTPHALLRACEAAVAHSPCRLAVLLTDALTPPTAHVLCSQFDSAVQSTCSECARRASRQVDELIFCVLPPESRDESRGRLVALGRSFDDIAAASVLRSTLGLGDVLQLRSARTHHRPQELSNVDELAPVTQGAKRLRSE